MTFRDPSPFGQRWLRFDPQRPMRPRLWRRFVVAVIGLLIACAALTLMAGV